MNKPELLAPAGNMKTLKSAIHAGADAVYLGSREFSARAFAGNFNDDELIIAIKYAAKHSVKAILAMNTLLTDRELVAAEKTVNHAYIHGISAFIVQDLGLARLIRRSYPKAHLHASTQMTATTLEDVEMLGKLGFKRVVLARELSREQIKYIAENTDIELEVFVHGALCSSYSGQCLISSFIGGRSANRGKCAQPCRLPYSSDKNSGVLLSLKDLCLVDYIEELAVMGVASLKIEGRMKGEEYVTDVVSGYRAVLDGNPLSAKQKEQMLSTFNRGGYTDGYYTNNKKDMYMLKLQNPYAGGAR